MISSGSSTSNERRNNFPFTATQWQELEHQALFYKYMAAGMPIPSDLLFSINPSLQSSLSSSSKFFPNYPSSSLGWINGYEQTIDPEPGRCRRTDGKKWRCSKEAYHDSKYCEKHMHKSKNRSRKPVEKENPTTHDFTTTGIAAPSLPNLLTSSILTNQSLLSSTTNSLYSFSSFSPHQILTSSTPTSHPSYHNKDYRERYFYGLKEEMGSSMRSFSGTSMDESWPLGGSITNLDNTKQSCYPNDLQGGYPNHLGQLQSGNNFLKQQEINQCHNFWGRDFKSELSKKVVEEEANDQKDPPPFL